MRLLEREGLVESEPGRRVRVATVSVDARTALTLIAQIAPAHDPAAVRAALRLAGDGAAKDAGRRERAA